jgi:sodium-dependent phosphate cotransporter
VTERIKKINTDNNDNNENDGKNGPSILTWVSIVALVYVLLLGVGIISAGFACAAGGKEGAEKIFAFATNPFMGLIMGIFATALIQSSSTITSVIVGMVAGGLPVSIAVPMIMGANIGTTITNTIVSLGHARHKDEFRRAFAAATIHDYFNLLSVVIFLPLEIAFGFLEKSGAYLTTLIAGSGSMSVKSFDFMKPITKPIVRFAFETVHRLNIHDILIGIILVGIGLALIVGSITYIGKLLKVVMVGRAKKILHTAIGRGAVTGIASGTVVTMIVQSSSTTTSLVVPLVGSGVFDIRQIYPFTLGANIGTCVTALLAATAITGPMASAALQIAFVHLLYNIIGVIVIYGIPYLRELPLKAAEIFAAIASERKSLAFAYIVTVFFFMPSMFMGISILK